MPIASTTARRLSLCLAAVALAGCVASAPAENGGVSSRDSGVGPGSDPVDEVSAGMIFSSVCGDTAPSFRKAPAAMAKMPFRQRPETGTYYHQNLDLSVKLMPKRCSMVFGSRADAGQLAILLTAASKSTEVVIDPNTNAARGKGPKGTRVEFDPMNMRDLSPMYRAVLIAP